MKNAFPSLIGIGLLLAGCAASPDAVPSMQTQPTSLENVIGTGTQADEGTIPVQPAASTGSMTTVSSRLTPLATVELGDTSAPNTLLVFLTPGSNYSVQFVHDILPQLTTTYVTPKKIKMQIVFVPFTRYPNTVSATVSLLCATRQDKGAAALMNLIENPTASIAKSLDLNQETFTACTKDAAVADAAKRHAAFATALNVTLVPTAFFNGTKSVGLPTWADLHAAMDASLLK